MIFNLTKSIHSGNPILQFADQESAEQAYKILNDAYPYNNYTYEGNAWNFHICCADGYDNGIVFNSIE